MSRLPLLDPDTAPESTRPALLAARQGAGYLSNLLAVLAHAPVALEAYQTLSAINTRASLTLAQREVVQLVAATTHGCAFCVAGHTALGLNKARLDPALVEALREGAALPDPKLEALARYTRDVIATRGAVDDSAFEAFLAAGHTQAQALEVVVGLGLATICNFANVLARTPLNPELQEHAWRIPA